VQYSGAGQQKSKKGLLQTEDKAPDRFCVDEIKKRNRAAEKRVIGTAALMALILFSVALLEIFTRALAGEWFQRAL